MREASPAITPLVPSAAAALLLAELHQQSFSEGWSATTFEEMILQPGIVILIVSEPTPSATNPQGFLVLRLVAEEAEILTIGIVPTARRRGLACALMSEATRMLGKNRCQSLFLEVACSNLAAQQLYRSLGFTQVGQRKNYYRHRDGRAEDALVLKRILII